jgi:hypothetical protein
MTHTQHDTIMGRFLRDLEEKEPVDPRPMTREQEQALRLDCLRLASVHGNIDVLDQARRYYEFVLAGVAK